MPRDLLDCPYCNTSLRIQTAVLGHRSAWCAECHRDIPIPNDHEPIYNDRVKPKRRAEPRVPWLLLMTIAVIVLIGVGGVLLVSKELGNRALPPMAAKAPASKRASPPLKRFPVQEPPGLRNGFGGPRIAPNNWPKRGFPDDPLNRPNNMDPFPPLIFAPPDFDMPSRLGRPSREWVTVPYNPEEYGVQAKLPAAAIRSTGPGHTTFRVTDHGTNYMIHIIELPPGVTVRKEDLEQGYYLGNYSASLFASTRIDGHSGYEAGIGRGGVLLCSAVQIDAQLYLFVVTSTNPAAAGETALRFIRSVQFVALEKPQP